MKYSQRMLALCVVVFGSAVLSAAEPLDIGSKRELFVDQHLIARTTGDAKQVLHQPTPQEVVLVTDKPWEGNTCAYYTIFQDGDLYRMYYRGSHYDTKTKKSGHLEVACYAESKDGIHWTKPELGVVEFEGSKKNNIVWAGVGNHCFTPFKDTNPACKPEARYKAVGRGRPLGKKGLYIFQSPDAIHWKLMHPEPVITEGAFDSQNLAFWDPNIKMYREYHRDFHNRVRDIKTGTSKDFINWSKPTYLNYPGAPKEHLYTNAIRPYIRAPHIYLGFPTRYLNNRQQQVEPTLMSSRDGRTFHRWTEPLIPRTAPKDRDGNRSNYMGWGLVQLPGDDKHLSVYGTEAYYTGPDSRLRRFSFRVDGFVSLHATEGEVLTKPLTFEGDRLTLNFETAKSGSVQVELQDAKGKPIEGFTFADSVPLQGDAIEQVVSWKGKPNLGSLAGKPIRLAFRLKDADLYSMRFGK